MLVLDEHIDKEGFRLRGVSSSRLDNFSDVVFGFALTLIVVSQKVPETYTELHEVLRAALPFGICFLLFVTVWLAHYRFFRHYGLQDVWTIWINLILLFTVLIYVYPLKFLFAIAIGHTPAGVFTNPYQPRELFIVYGAGFTAIYLLFAALYANAWRLRKHLCLDALETTLTLSHLWNHLGNAFIGIICCMVARLLPLDDAGAAGYAFFLIPLWQTLHGFLSARYIRKAHPNVRLKHIHSAHEM